MHAHLCACLVHYIVRSITAVLRPPNWVMSLKCLTPRSSPRLNLCVCIKLSNIFGTWSHTEQEDSAPLCSVYSSVPYHAQQKFKPNVHFQKYSVNEWSRDVSDWKHCFRQAVPAYGHQWTVMISKGLRQEVFIHFPKFERWVRSWPWSGQSSASRMWLLWYKSHVEWVAVIQAFSKCILGWVTSGSFSLIIFPVEEDYGPLLLPNLGVACLKSPVTWMWNIISGGSSPCGRL